MSPRAIIFDFFGVFCAESAKYWYAAHSSDESYESLRSRVIYPYDQGTLSAQDAYEELGKATHMSGEEVHADWLARAQVDTEMVTYGRDLSSRYPIALCTNANSLFLREVFARHSLETLFPTVVISSEERIVKPDPELYRITLKRMGCTPEETVFVDDRSENVVAAEMLGMKGVLFTDTTRLREALETLQIR